ncbi:hypothetical protein NDU88_006116 [Pleurodeles waltl]|uniref:Uncharacterized protein n=1 Tax=Pleurodeles waltl TaxID=8319 RepID=A0AAV7MZH5_PLEWA|nr:hypothetical protein NDU88_006116 [Pleurodeles waltl]
MGKADQNQANLQFDRRKSGSPASDLGGRGMGGFGMSSGEEQDLRQSFVAIQHSLPQIDGKIDSLSFRIDRMTERLDKHADRLDQSERRVSEVEDGQAELATGHASRSKELSSLQTKVNDLEARRNLRIVGVAESNAIDNMEDLIERLLVQLLVRATFSDLFVVDIALCSLATRPPLGAPPHPNIVRLRDAALSQARKQKTLQHEGMVISLYPDFTMQSMIIAVQAEDGSETRDPVRIAARFRDYYEPLYASGVAPDQEALMDYCARIDMLRLTDVDRESLMAPLILKEMNRAIGGMTEGWALESGQLEANELSLREKFRPSAISAEESKLPLKEGFTESSSTL